MMRDRQRGSGAAAVVVWPPDDTEESVLGTNLHQDAIVNLRLGLNELASALSLPDGTRPWHAHGQTAISGWRRRDGSPYTTLPDVYVYRQAIDRRRATFALDREGPPLLIIEVLSPTTARVDLDENAGKPYSFALGGVVEYLVLDPLGERLAEQGRGWRLEGDHYRPWRPDAQGRWQSAQLPFAIGLEGVEVAVYGPDSRRQGREGEFAPALARQQAELARQQAELARQQAEISALRRQLEQRTQTEE